MVLVALVGIANFVVLLAQASALVHGLYLNADNASAFVLPALAGHAPPGSVVNLGDHPWYEMWWFMRATAELPGHRGLWEAAPILFGLLGIAAVTACAWYALGWLAGLLSGVALLAASESLRGVLYVPESHGLIVLHLGVLSGALLIVHRRALGGELGSRALLVVGVPLVVFTGAGLTDQLLSVSALGPFLLAPPICWLRLRSRAWRTVSLFALVTGVGSGLLALLLTHLMQEQHVVHAPFPINFVSEAWLVGLQNLIVTFLTLGGGDFFGASVSGHNLRTFIIGALILLALAGILRSLWRWAGATKSSAEPLSTRAGSRELFIAYWGLVLVFVFAAVALTSVSEKAPNDRYLVGAWAAAAVLLGILSTTPAARTVIIVGVALFGVLNLGAELSGGVPAYGPGPDRRAAGAIEHFVKANGAKIGYSGYWDAAPVTWETRLGAETYPIRSCGLPTGWCQFYAAKISTWYVPRPHTRTFLLTDTRPGVPLTVTSPPARFGSPLARQVVGSGLTVFVYDHDIAAEVGP